MPLLHSRATPLPRLTSIILTSPFVPTFRSLRSARHELLIFNSDSSFSLLSRGPLRDSSVPPPSLHRTQVLISEDINGQFLFFVEREKNLKRNISTRLIVALIIRTIYHAFAYMVSRNIHRDVFLSLHLSFFSPRIRSPAKSFSSNRRSSRPRYRPSVVLDSCPPEVSVNFESEIKGGSR